MSPAQDHGVANARTVAIIVTYNPVLENFMRLLHAISPQVDAMLVVDNGSGNSAEVRRIVESSQAARFTGLPKNMGIAHAQNVGIRIAHGQGAAYVLTLDQDSVPSPGMVATLASVYERDAQHGRIAVVGPILKDEESQLPLPLFSYVDGRKQRITPREGPDLIEVAFLVSSGSLLDMRALKEIGLMRDELFISYVDVELCLRAKALGYRIIACCAAVMEHNLGDQRLRIGRWMLPLHSPLRHFHLLRSGVYMQKLPQIPAVWKRADRRQLVRSFIVFSIVGLPRLHEFNAMLRGWIAGRRMHVQPVPTLSRPAGPVGS